MAIQFEFYESPDPTGGKEKRYHARVVSPRNISTDHLAEEIHAASTLTVADIKATLIALGEKLAQHLENGERVHLKDIGYFQLTLTCPEEASPTSTRSGRVKFKSVAFRADKTLKLRLQNIKTERAETKIHSNDWSDSEIEKELTEYFIENPVLTRLKFQKLTGFTIAKACRYIQQLKQEGRLLNISTPHNPIYMPAPGCFGRKGMREG